MILYAVAGIGRGDGFDMTSAILSSLGLFRNRDGLHAISWRRREAALPSFLE